jgi:cell wall assembly regulator SMI1
MWSTPLAAERQDVRLTERVMLNESWGRVERWLASNAPRILGSLNPPASDGELAAAEAAVGQALPSGLRDLYRRHDGMSVDENLGSLFFGMRFLTLSDAVADHAETDGSAFSIGAADPGIVTGDTGAAIWVPFAAHGHRCRLCVDLSPAVGGTVGQVIFVDQDALGVAILVASSVERMLCSFAEDLESGKYFLHTEALKDGEQFLDCVSEIDLLNWWESPRWAHLKS